MAHLKLHLILLLVLAAAMTGYSASSTPPAAPSNVSATIPTMTSVDLTWRDNSTNETNFRIFNRLGTNGTFNQIGQVSANITNFTATSLNPGQLYQFQIQARADTVTATSEVLTVQMPIINGPGNLAATLTGPTSLNLTWTDNSTGETDYFIGVRVGTNGSFGLYTSLPPNSTNLSIPSLSAGATYQFLVEVVGPGGTFADSSIVTVTLSNVISAPTNLIALATGPGTVKLTWADTSTNEVNFYIGYRAGTTGSFSLFPGGALAANTTNFTANGVLPGQTYQFLVEAYLDDNNVADSAIATVVTPTLFAPSNMTATALSPSQVKLNWKDNSTNETKFYVAYRVGTNGSYTIATGGELPANSTNFTLTGLAPGTQYQFLVETYFDDYAVADSTVLGTTHELLAPSNLTATVLSATSVRLAWKDNATNETKYYIAYRAGTNGPYSIPPGGELPANSTNFTLTGLAPATEYEFLVEAYFDDTAVRDLTVMGTTLNAFTSRGFHPATIGLSISPYTISSTTSLEAPESFNVTGLPPGLEFDGTNQITGTPTQAGVFVAQLSAFYPLAGTINGPLTFRVIHPPGPPVVVSNLPNQTLAATSAPVAITLAGRFNDPDTEQAVRFVTTKGNFDVALYATAVPQTVSNFLGYVNRGDYQNSAVTRASFLFGNTPFVVQGGGYKPSGTNFTETTRVASPTNEPGIQHIRGTLAMAKVGGQPNSASDEWFVNLRDNSDQLDDQNGGFAAFARVCGNGMSVADAIINLPHAVYTNTVFSGTNAFQHAFDDFPVDTAGSPPATYDPALLVLVQSVTNIAPLSYSVVGNSAPSVASAAINGTNLVVTPVTQFGGSTTIAVAATDLDGNSVTNEFTVQVTGAFTTWLNSFSLTGSNALPSADGDGDTLVNAAEFALMGSPVSSNALTALITRSFVTVSNQQYLALAFQLRKDLGGATVLMLGSSTLSNGSWTPVWTSADLSGPLVIQKLDQGDHWQLTIRDSAPAGPAGSGRFLNLRLQTPP